MLGQTEHELDIAQKVDAKARAIAEGRETWDDDIVREMRIALTFQLTEAEIEFLDRYVAWRRHTPL
jgi:hypothetical protein